MKKIWLVVIGLALIIGVVGFTGCGEGTSGTLQLTGNLAGQQEGIWVSGEGKVQADPDVATINIGVQAQAATAAEAQAQVSQGMNNVMQVLKDQGIDEKDIQTQYYNVTQLTRWNDTKQEQDITGYQVTNSIVAKVRDVTKAGAVIDAVVNAAGDLIRINGINFSVDDPTDYLNQARTLAIQNAKAKAQQLAGDAGVSLGKITYITESNYYPTPIYRSYAMDAAAPEAVGGTSISPGQLDVTVNVQVVYALN